MPTRRSITSTEDQFDASDADHAKRLVDNTELIEADAVVKALVVLKDTVDDLINNDEANENIVGTRYWNAVDTTGLTSNREGTTGANAGAGLGISFVEQTTSNSSHFSIASDEITIATRGIYKIDLNVTTIMTTGDNRTESAAVLQAYSTSTRSWNEIPGTKMYMYNRLNGIERTTAACTTIFEITGIECKIRVRYFRTGGVGTIGLEPNASAITITNLT
jgi:hypothetical protein